MGIDQLLDELFADDSWDEVEILSLGSGGMFTLGSCCQTSNYNHMVGSPACVKMGPTYAT